MGNASTKESRGGDASSRAHHHGGAREAGGGTSLHSDRSSSRRNRVGRGELSGLLGLGATPGSQADPPYERRETKQEREARRLERDRVARIAERERSMKEELVDGGYLVTLGTYTSPEDFNKQIVRQLVIERKLAPFWRGLNDFDDQWTEPQIIAAARGLPIPAADQTPPEELIPRPVVANPLPSTAQTLDSLTVPIGDRSQSTSSDHAMSVLASALPSPVSGQAPRTNSPFKPRGKAIAAVLGGNSRNGSTTEIMPREIHMPYDPFVNGQPIEVYLYKDSTECPICFLTYPPYLNHTRCCDQPICSECFVQIKRPDPHFPEGHNENDPNHNPEETAGLLISEPACCPYCTQPDFGVSYEPPPFRRGLTYTVSPATLGTGSAAMSSSSSINSATLSPGIGSPASGLGRRRAQSLSASSPSVILTDRIRPEWANKLQSARAHQARRAAAATALHTAAFLMGGSENRAFRSRFGRRNTAGSGSAGASPAGVNNGDGENGDSGSGTPSQSGPDQNARGGGSLRGPPGGGSSRRSRLEDLEEMMLAEAVRLSLAAEEERKRKVEKEERKEERKEAKKREKEARKAAKAAGKHPGPYETASGRSGHSSASGSSLSLPGLSFGRKRGNSAASNLRIEASVASAMATGESSETTSKDKGKGIERPATSPAEDSSGAVSEPAVLGSSAGTSSPRAIPHLPAGPSHLRQMSNASSVSSSVFDSQHGSYTSPSHLQDPRGSGLSLGSRSGASEDGGDQDRDRDPSASTEPMFNFRSLAEVVGVSLEGENAGRRLSLIEAERKENERSESNSPENTTSGEGEPSTAAAKAVDGATVELIEEVPSSQPVGVSQENHAAKQGSKDGTADEEAAPASSASLSPPTVTITPDTPAEAGVDNDAKQLGCETAVERVHQATQ
ncbi:hypothetical protein C8A05DRAFT_13878 [Staphylotrichum tortipilum]|uniref:Protein sip5 n=1 Tax=Staphylotrichum tortipilum TaxID=2831512 RepID=A0AAN6MPP1_9PEZI|nr:hypothetical protein C8A05DRAFT_13878 [Staphylotrichum longicolle]